MQILQCRSCVGLPVPSEHDWKGIVDQAMPAKYSQKERCWRDDADGKAGKPGAWAF